MWISITLLAALSVLTNAAALRKRDDGNPMRLTNNALMYYGKDLCTYWKMHCNDIQSVYGKTKRSTCREMRKDHDYTTVVEVTCDAITKISKSVTPITKDVAKYQNWQSPKYGVVVPHIAKAAADFAHAHPGHVFDNRERNEYLNFLSDIQAAERNNTPESLVAQYNQQYSKYFTLASHIQRYDVPEDEDSSEDLEEVKADAEAKVLRADIDVEYIDNSPKKQIPEIMHPRERKRPQTEKLSIGEYLAKSELERQDSINRAAALAGNIRPFPKTVLKKVQWLKYRDEAFQHYGYEKIQNKIETWEQFVEKKSKGEILAYPA